MEIQYTQFNKLMDSKNFHTDLEPRKVIEKELLQEYVDGYLPRLTKKQKAHIESKFEELSDKTPQQVFYDLKKEIELNLANIPGANTDQIVRYLQFIKKGATQWIDSCKVRFDYDTILKNTDYEHEYLGDVKYYNEDEEWDLGASAEIRYNGKNPIGWYLGTCRHPIDDCQRLIDFIKESLNTYIPPSVEPTLVLENELTANTHKLLLFHKMGLLEPLYLKYRTHIGVVKFAKLLGTLLGVPEDKHESFRKSLDDFINETFNSPTNGDIKKTVETPRAEKKINAYLAEMGIINPL